MEDKNLKEEKEIKETNKKVIKISLLSESNLNDFYKELDIMFNLNQITADNEILITNIRHKNLIEDAIKHTKDAKESLRVGMPIDIISINIPEMSLNVKVSDEEMAARKAKWQPKEPSITTGYLARYREMVTSGNRGAILEVPKK